jgi:hypothetical protein
VATNGIQIGRFNSLLSKLLGMSGEIDPVPTLAPEMVSVLALEVDRPEWAFLKGERRLQCFGLPTGTAVFRGIFVARNPAGSGTLAVLESINVTPSSGAVQSFYLGLGLGALSVSTLGLIVRDTRQNSAAVSGPATLAVATVAQVALPPLIEEFYHGSSLAAVGELVPLDIILSPGREFAMWGDIGATATFKVNLKWRERVLEAAETR